MIGTATFPRPVSAASTDVGERVEGTTWVFYLLLLMLVFEFLGLDRQIPPLRAIRFSTLLAYTLFASILIKGGVRAITGSPQSVLLAIFVVFNLITIPIAVVQMYAFTAFRTHFDYFGLFVVTWYVVDRPVRLKQFAIVASVIILVMVGRNVDRLLAADRSAAGGFDAGYFVSNGNDFAWGLNVLLPFAILLVVTRQKFIWRMLGLGSVATALFGIVGTQSRGATIALGLAALFYWAFVMKRKALGMAVLVVAVVGIFAIAPPEYFQRMKSIQNYQEDNSAMSRFQLWRAAALMAIDYPLGVGGDNFASAYGRYYIPDAEHELRTWAQGKWLSAHSVYFRLLGEYGFLGVVWVGILLTTNWRHNWAAYHLLRQNPASDGTPPQWPLLLNMSLIGYAISGIFLGGVAYPHLHLLSGLTAAAYRQGVWHSQSVAAAAAKGDLVPVSGAAPGRGAAPRPGTHMPSIAERARQMMQARRRAS